MNKKLTREDFLDMERDCQELACGEHAPEDRERFEKLARRYGEKANQIQNGRRKMAILTEIATRLLLVFGAIFYVIGSLITRAGEECWKKADSNRGKPNSVYRNRTSS